jgi:hypothetical protein
VTRPRSTTTRPSIVSKLEPARDPSPACVPAGDGPVDAASSPDIRTGVSRLLLVWSSVTRSSAFGWVVWRCEANWGWNRSAGRKSHVFASCCQSLEPESVATRARHHTDSVVRRYLRAVAMHIGSDWTNDSSPVPRRPLSLQRFAADRDVAERGLRDRGKTCCGPGR